MSDALLPTDLAACHALIRSIQTQLHHQEGQLCERDEQLREQQRVAQDQQRSVEEKLRLVQNQLREQQRFANEQIASLKAEREDLFEKLRLARLRLFGRSSEKAVSPDQLSLCFNEAEAVAAIEPIPADSDESLPARRPRKPRRTLAQSVPAGTPVIEIVHELPEEQRRCPLDGQELHLIGEEVSHQIDIIPPRIELHKHIRRKYGCRCCENGVHVAPLPPQCLPGTLATASTAALVITGKFVDHMPFYRQIFALSRIGLAVSRATLCHWAVKLGELVVPLINLYEDHAQSAPIMQIDATPMQVLREPRRNATSESTMWVRRAVNEGHPILLFDYREQRNRETVQALLGPFEGCFVQHDDANVFYGIDTAKPHRHVGCHAHARRKFVAALKSLPKKQQAGSVANEAIQFYKQLYRIEAELRDAQAPPAERYRRRQTDSIAILQRFEVWWKDKLPGASPASALGKALRYLASNWSELAVYVEDGRLEIDNNLTENAIRPFALGRKNWMFSTTPEGAQASARLYSIVETAKANRLDPFFYLRYIFEHLPRAKTLEDIEQLLPWNIDLNQLLTFP